MNPSYQLFIRTEIRNGGGKYESFGGKGIL